MLEVQGKAPQYLYGSAGASLNSGRAGRASTENVRAVGTAGFLSDFRTSRSAPAQVLGHRDLIRYGAEVSISTIQPRGTGPNRSVPR